jgi:hypothetical protein
VLDSSSPNSLRCSYVRLVASSRRHHIFENRGCGWHPCCTSRVHCSLHPMIQLRYTRLIYLGNCRTILSSKLEGQLTSPYERVRKTLDDSFSLKQPDIIHSLFPIPARGSSHGKVGHHHLSMEANSGEVGRLRYFLINRKFIDKSNCLHDYGGIETACTSTSKLHT